MAGTYIRNGVIQMFIFVDGIQKRKTTKLKNTKQNMIKVQKELLPDFITSSNAPTIDMKLQYYIDRYLEEKKHICKERTYERYTQLINKWIKPTYGNKKVVDIKSSMVKKYINNQLDMGKSIKSIELYITVFRGILQEAVYDEVILANPFRNLKRRKKEKPIVIPFSKDEVNLLLKNTEGWFHNYIGIATHTGMRSGEMIGLKWIDIDDKYIKVRRTRDMNKDTTPKTEASIRDIPIFASVRKFIDSQRKITGDFEYIFIAYGRWNRIQQPWSDTQWISQGQWYPLLEKLGLQKRRPYEMRHTFATNMLNSGHFKVTEIAHILGHTTTEYLFNVYSRYIKSEKDSIPLDKDIY